MKETRELQLQEIYKAYPILQKINETNKQVLDKAFQFKTIECGAYLSGEECPGFIFIIEGCIKIEKIDLEGRQTSLYEIGRGEICHESLSCHLKCEDLEINGRALTITRIGLLPKEVVQKYLLRDIDFMQELYKNLYHKLKVIISHKESIIHQSIEDRLIAYIKRDGKQVIYATHQDIAVELGSSREVISRKLKQLEREGVVELGRGKIKIMN